MRAFDVEFTHLGTRYETDCETYRILFDMKGTEWEPLFIAAGLKNGAIKPWEEGL